MKANITLILTLLFVSLLGSPSHAQITLKVGDAQGAPGKEVEVPILISGSTKTGPMQFVLDYDHKMLEAIADPPDVEPRGVVFGKLIGGGMIAQNAAEPGAVKIALRTDEPITQDGELVRVRFLVKGKGGDSCTLNILVPEAWEKQSLFEVPVHVQPGNFRVAGSGIPLPLLIAILAGLAVLVLIIVMVLRRSKTNAAAAPARGPTETFPPTAPPAPVASVPVPAAGPAPKNAEDPMVLLKKLKDMKDAGLITEEDFDRKKKDLLERI